MTFSEDIDGFSIYINKIIAVAIRTAPVRRLVFAICTGVRRFHRISL